MGLCVCVCVYVCVCACVCGGLCVCFAILKVKKLRNYNIMNNMEHDCSFLVKIYMFFK